MSAIFGETLTFTQENGPDVRLMVFGDEFYSRYETSTGYSAVYDGMLGLYCYATRIDGEFVSSGISIATPTPDGLRRHLKETPAVRNAKFDLRFRAMQPPEDTMQGVPTLETFGPNKGLLRGRQVNLGEVRGLTILINFQDVQTSLTADEVSAMLNGENYTANGNYCSVREYYRLMSNGLLDYSNLVVGPITLSRKRQYYVNNHPAVAALNMVADMGIDLAQFDSRDEGILDAVSFMYAGQTLYDGWLWPHNFTLDWSHGDFRTNMYQISSLGKNSGDLSIGTFCHESGHMLCRFPDLYDYGKRDGDFERSAGIGRYCLMSSGNHLDHGRTPSPISAYLRYLAQWCPNKVLLKQPGEYAIVHGDYGTVYIYETDSPTEFFLLENRSQIGLDQHLPASGLAIYHCDTRGSNEWQGGSATDHYQCGLMQADGHFDMEHNLNRGDEGDLFSMIEGEALTDNTHPSSRLWDGSDSGLYIADIGDAGEAITLQVL